MPYLELFKLKAVNVYMLSFKQDKNMLGVKLAEIKTVCTT